MLANLKLTIYVQFINCFAIQNSAILSFYLQFW